MRAPPSSECITSSSIPRYSLRITMTEAEKHSSFYAISSTKLFILVNSNFRQNESTIHTEVRLIFVMSFSTNDRVNAATQDSRTARTASSVSPSCRSINWNSIGVLRCCSTLSLIIKLCQYITITKKLNFCRRLIDEVHITLNIVSSSIVNFEGSRNYFVVVLVLLTAGTSLQCTFTQSPSVFLSCHIQQTNPF